MRELSNNLRFEALTSFHDVSSFQSSSLVLNDFLQKHALNNQKAGLNKTFVLLEENQIIGFYSFCAAQFTRTDLPADRQFRWFPRYPLPAILLARLAIDEQYMGLGLGAELLIHALEQTLKIADNVGAVILIVDAKDQTAQSFYRKYGFIDAQETPLRMFLTFKTIRKLLIP